MPPPTHPLQVRWQTAGYNRWALSEAYYKAAIDRALRPDGGGDAGPRGRPVALVFFTGGGFNRAQQREDRQWVRDRLASRYDDHGRARDLRTYLEPEGMDHVTSMACMARCDALVVSASSFSWWAGFLSDNRTTKVIIAPRDIHDESFGFSPADYYPAHWTLLGEGDDTNNATAAARSNFR